MSKRTFLVASLVATFVVALSFSFHVSSAQDHPQGQEWKGAFTSLQDSLKLLRLQIDSLKQQSPGLSDYMTTIQLHAAKLWFAFTALNWELADYEVNELNEIIERAKALHAFKNSVNTASVLQSVQGTQISSMRNAIASKDHQLFSAAYHQTLEACNGCHKSAGYGFISIAMPAAPPVSNQDWNVH